MGPVSDISRLLVSFPYAETSLLGGAHHSAETSVVGTDFLVGFAPELFAKLGGHDDTRQGTEGTSLGHCAVSSVRWKSFTAQEKRAIQRAICVRFSASSQNCAQCTKSGLNLLYNVLIPYLPLFCLFDAGWPLGAPVPLPLLDDDGASVYFLNIPSNH